MSLAVKKKNCELKTFCDILKVYLKKENKTDDEKKGFFAAHCEISKVVF